MRMTMAALLTTALLPAPATADHEPNPVPRRVVEQSLDIAREAFPAGGCRGREALWMDEAADALLDQAGIAGFFTGGETCTILAPSTTRNPVSWCTVLVHEFGHAAGAVDAAHTGQPPGSVLASPPGIWPPCRPLHELAPRRILHPLARVREEAKRRPSHRWTCRRVHRDLAECVGQPGPTASTTGRIRWRRADGDTAWTETVVYRPRGHATEEARER